MSETGKNSFTMSPTRWINEFDAIGISQKERLIMLNEETNREKELFNKNKEKTIYRLEDKTSKPDKE